jgi:putative oxygen-independent coproporphyrinogen III oxidase
MPGLYVHIPFCVHKCDYCDFYSLPGRLNSLDDYIQALCIEAKQYSSMNFQTLYLGGGTPSLLRASGITILLNKLRAIFNLSHLSEATFEANPESVTADLLDVALSSGLNRISIGVQSLSDFELKRVGRIHNSSQALRALEIAVKAGFKNISADAILGLPGQGWISLHNTLGKLAGLGLQHISIYCLAVEPHTPLAAKLPPDLPDDDVQADLYEKAVEFLIEQGYRHYEISNFARPGYECLHNLNYWRGGEYLGLGPGAASHLGGRRFKNRSDLDDYLSNPVDQIEDVEELSATAKAAEEIIIRLRLMDEGADIEELAQKFGRLNTIQLSSRLDHIVIKGYIKRTGTRFYLAPEYALVSNSILSQLLGD